jgi:hypothetical protein
MSSSYAKCRARVTADLPVETASQLPGRTAGQPTRESVYYAADRAQQRLGMSVNPVIRSADAWRKADDPLVRQIQSSPFVAVLEPDDSVAGEARTADE